MQGPETLYFFTNDQNIWWYVQNDLVLPSPTPIPLQYAPDGWEDIGIINQRNQKYFIMDRSFSIPLEFVEDGARILKDKAYKKGKGEKVYLVIAKQQLFMDATHYGFYYTLLYKGEIDFSEFSHEGPKVVVNIMEGGLVKYVKARENVKYQMPVDAADTIKIKWTGIKLRQKASFLISNGAVLNDRGTHIVEMILLGTENIQSIGAKSTTRTVVNSSGDIFPTKEWCVQTGSTATQLTITYNFGISLSLMPGFGAVFGTRYFFQLRGYDSGGTQTVFQNIIDYNPGDPLLLYQHHRFSGSATYTIPANTQVFIDSLMSVNGGNTVYTYDDDSKCDVEYSYTHRTTYIKARRPLGLFQDLTTKVTDGTAQAESNTLNTYKHFVVTSGDAIRGIAGANIKTCLYDYYRSYNTMLSIGMGAIKGKLKLERKVDLVDYTAPIGLGECKGLKVSFDKDYNYSSIKIGCPEQDYDDVNGKQEFNCTHVYTTPDTSDGKELDLVSIYRFDCYGAEFVRINLDGKTTTDSDSDNDIWVIAINPTPIMDPVEGEVYELDRSLNPYATGLLEPATIFNLPLTPKQCLFRNGPYIRSCFYKQDTEFLRFQTTEKNSSLSVAPPGSPVITENADVENAQLGQRLFVPVKLEFDTRVPFDLLEQLDINPLKSFGTSYVGVPLVGIPNRTGIHPEDNAAQAYELLASPDTDLSLLIDVFE